MAATTKQTKIHYEVTPVDPAAHLFEINMRIDKPDPNGQIVWLPAWIPGSYLIRDFARNVVQIAAKGGRQSVGLNKLDKHSWQADPVSTSLTLTYRVYAWDLSVRGAHLDQTHGFFNGTSVFLCPKGFESEACTVTIRPPAGPSYKNWRVATSLEQAGAPLWGFGKYRAANYDELIDHPVEMGSFQNKGFTAGGARHEIVITGEHDADFDRLIADIKPICEQQIAFFEPRRKRAPVKRYVFLTTAVGDGYGGLEHRSSTALICSRKDLPFKGMSGTPAGYQTFLGLVSHEYFHTWNVKRIKPARFAPYELSQESYSELLWVFEGFTSYYDDLMLLRSGIIELTDYLKLLSKTISQVQRGPGRKLQSIAESSFDAWTRFYKQDENAANAIVSYYSKGALVALALDLTIREKSDHKKSLDDVMRLLWKKYGRQFEKQQSGVSEKEMPGLILEATGVDVSRQIRQWVYGTQDIALGRMLRAYGIKAKSVAAESSPVWLGVRCANRNGQCSLASVYTDGPAHQGGLSAGDIPIALNQMRIQTESGLNALLRRAHPGQTVEISAFRGDLLMNFEVTLQAPPDSAVELLPDTTGKKTAGKKTANKKAASLFASRSKR